MEPMFSVWLNHESRQKAYKDHKKFFLNCCLARVTLTQGQFYWVLSLAYKFGILTNALFLAPLLDYLLMTTILIDRLKFVECDLKEFAKMVENWMKEEKSSIIHDE